MDNIDRSALVEQCRHLSLLSLARGDTKKADEWYNRKVRLESTGEQIRKVKAAARLNKAIMIKEAYVKYESAQQLLFTFEKDVEILGGKHLDAVCKGWVTTAKFLQIRLTFADWWVNFQKEEVSLLWFNYTQLIK